jgi:hypothetical protein
MKRFQNYLYFTKDVRRLTGRWQKPPVYFAQIIKENQKPMAKIVYPRQSPHMDSHWFIDAKLALLFSMKHNFQIY